MDTSTIDILELIPQRPPFVLVDTLVDFEPERSVTAFEVKADCILARDGHLGEAGLMENIAQSCAARIGYINKYRRNETVKLGIIGAVKDLKVNFLPKAGSVVTTTIETISEVFGITLVSAVAECEEGVAASCQMKISLTDIEQKG